MRRIDGLLNKAINAYGEGNIVFLAPMIGCKDTDEKMKSINWGSGEAYSLTRQEEGVSLLVFQIIRTISIWA